MEKQECGVPIGYQKGLGGYQKGLEIVQTIRRRDKIQVLNDLTIFARTSGHSIVAQSKSCSIFLKTS